MHSSFLFPLLLSNKNTKLPRYWLMLAVYSLSISGFYALAPLILRAPFFKKYGDFHDIFAYSLVTHVNLSVLVWFLAFIALGWAWNHNTNTSNKISFSWSDYFSTNPLFILTASLGALCIALSPFFPAYGKVALKNNYIPILYSPYFMLGLSLFSTSLLLKSFHVWINSFFHTSKSLLSLYTKESSLIILIAVGCILWTKFTLPMHASFYLGKENYYNSIFWGGGHVLQYAFVHLMLITWLELADTASGKHISAFLEFRYIFHLNLFFACLAPLGYILYPETASAEQAYFFTCHMRWCGGIAPLLMVCCFIRRRILGRFLLVSPYGLALSLSLLLFGAGGGIGYAIAGHNVTIPAHYHGSIVGITVALMGISYRFLPLLGHALPKAKRMKTQLTLYGLGQLGHITGLAWMGGYGFLRKSTSTLLTINTKIAMAIFIIGGIGAMAGGVFYCILMIKSFHKKENSSFSSYKIEN